MKKLMIVTCAALAVVSCGPEGNKPNIEVVQDMMEQPALKAQDFQPYDHDKSSMYVPPEGTWPSNRKPLLYSGKPIEAGNELKNPIDGQMLDRGRINYSNYCLVCHGSNGMGDGPVADKFVGKKPPSLLTDLIKNYPDGRIYHIITYGQGLMGSYINQMPSEEDRWAVVNYVRSLQKGN